MRTNIYTHPSGLEHDTGEGHPEQPARLRAVLNLLREKPFSALAVHEAPEADTDRIALAHDPAYIENVKASIPAKGLNYLDSDTALSPGSWEAALRAAGAVCKAVDDIMAGKAGRAFCAMRPPGHHAEPGAAMGFCIFSNIAIGALHAQEKHGLKKIALVDFDVHHGNGTDKIARLHEGLFYASSHQWPLFPGTGHPKDGIPGKIVNAILSEGDGSAEFRALYEDRLLPAIDSFAPELIMISAGFDAHRDDPLAGIDLAEDDFAWITRELVALAEKHTGGKIVSVLEGGYNLAALKNSAAAHLNALAGF